MSTSVEREFIQVQNDLREDYKRKKTSPIVEVWRSRPTKGILFLFCFSIIVPVLIYYFIIDKGTHQNESSETCAVDKMYRIPCGRAQNTMFDNCTEIHCCFDSVTKRCFHYLPSKYYYFNENEKYISSQAQTPFFKDQLKSIHLSIKPSPENNSVQIILHNDSNPGEITCNNTTQYNCTLSANPLFVEFHRADSGDLLLTTARGPMILSEYYWEWSFQLTDEYLFGLGQTLIDLDENSTLTKVIYGNDKDHNTLPNFLAYKNKQYHGLVIRHSGPLEITVLPSKLVNLKSLSGKEITLELSVGPTIKEVINQQNKNRGNSTVSVDTLGVHICREGNSLTLKEILQDFTNKKELEIQYATDCLHENLLLAAINEDNNSDTINNMIDLINTITANGHRFALSILPQVSYDSSLYSDTQNFNIYFQVNQTTDYKGQYFENDVVYPYFNHPNISDFVDKLIETAKIKFGTQWPTDFILGRNWPSDQAFVMKEIEDFQYLSKELLEAMSFTLPWNVSSDDKLQFLDHNNYGYSHVDKISAKLNPDDFIMTASHTIETFQPIIIQNVDISWTNFQNAIKTILSNSIFGYPLTSIPVCGSTETFTTSHESLCIRWYLMASTAPIFRISSHLPRRDPNSLAELTSDYATNQMKWAIDFRYSLMYYMYTILNNEEPLMRPMFYDFPDDNNTFALVDQYMVGGNLLVAHPTLPDQSQIRIYLPNSVNYWFEFWGGEAYGYSSANKNGWISLAILEADWVGFIPEGAIIPLVTTTKTNNDTINEVRLKVALNCTENCVATGTMRTGSSQLFNFTCTDSELTILNQQVADNFVLSQVEIFAANCNTTYLKLNDTLGDKFSYPYSHNLTC